MNGVVSLIKIDKGYGFIEAEKTGDNYFFHKDDFLGDWNSLVEEYKRRNQNFPTHKISVEFKETRSPKGLRARNVNRN